MEQDSGGDGIPAVYEERHPTAGKVLRIDRRTGGQPEDIMDGAYGPFDSLNDAVLSISVAKNMSQGAFTRFLKLTKVVE
jgi:hypothetical protein